MLGVATVGLAATGRVAINGGSAGTPLTTCINGGSVGTPLIGYETWHCLHRGEPKVLDAFYATPKPLDPGASLATARWALAHCLEPLWPSEMATVDRLAPGGG